MKPVPTNSSAESTKLESFLGRHRWFLALVSALLTLTVIVLRFRLWHFDLTVPLAYRNDALYFLVAVKALGENAWNYFIPRLGAPFGLEGLDFPINCTLDFAMMKLGMILFGAPGLVVNLYWILSVSLAAAFAALFFRFLRVRPIPSITFGVLFGIIPFVFFRSVAHLNLVTYLVPASAYVAVGLARGDLLRAWLTRKGSGLERSSLRPLFLSLVICLAAGFTYIYWAFFTCVVVSLGAVIGFVRSRNRAGLALAGILVATVALAATLNMAASLRYWHSAGRNSELAFKRPSEADIYGLRIRQMLTPVESNGLPFLQRLREKIVAGGFPEDARDANESVSSALGTVGSLGFLLLLAVAVASCVSPAKPYFDENPRILAGLTLCLILLGHTGGFGGLFNIFVTSEFRCYNRVSPFISLFCFAILALSYDRFFGARHWLTQAATSIFLIGFAALDQIPLRFLQIHRLIETEFYQDKETFSSIESRLPSGAAVFQLPFTPFPLDSGIHQLSYYANAKPYLQTRTLRWSWGEMMGRHGNWNRHTASLPAEKMLERVAYAGFSAVVINRGGYPDRKLEDEIAGLTGVPLFASADGRWAFYDLQSYAAKLRATMSGEAWQMREQKARFPIGLDWKGAFSILETSGDKRWRWCGRYGELQIRNPSPGARTIEIRGEAQQPNSGSTPLVISAAGEERRLMLGEGPTPFSLGLSLPPHSTTTVHFRFDGPLLRAPNDPRELAFQLTGFAAYEGGDLLETAD